MTSITAVATLTGTSGAGDGAGTEDWFNPVDFLGKRGTRLLPRGAQLTAACATLLPFAGLESIPAHRRGVWVATSTFAEQMHATMDEIIRVDGSNGLSPAQAPYFSVNLVASRLSKDVQSHGMATTITTPGTGLADALAAALLAIRAGRVDRALVACTEVSVPSESEPVRDGSVSFLLDQEGLAESMALSVLRGFVAQGSPMPCLPTELSRDHESDGEHRELVVFTDLPHTDPCLHSVLDLEGEGIDACVYPLGSNMMAQGLELARLIEQRQAATFFTICASGQWSRIHLQPVGGTAL